MALTNSKTRLSVVQKVARRMMLYPIVYIIFLLPQAVVRFLTFTGHGASIPTDATLFILTRPSVTAGRTFFPRSLRPFFGLSPDDGDQAQPITLHQSSAQGASNPSMGQAGGINILVSVERQHDGGPDARTVPLRAAWKRPTGLHGTVASLAHHDRNSFSATAYSTHQDRRKISFEDERVGRPSNVSESKWSDDTHEEKDFIQPPPAPTPVAPSLPQRVITIGYNEGSDWQTGVFAYINARKASLLYELGKPLSPFSFFTGPALSTRTSTWALERKSIAVFRSFQPLYLPARLPPNLVDMPEPWPTGVKVGVCILALAGALSFVSTVILLVAIAIAAYKNRSDDRSFGRSHLAAYFVCLLICDAIEGVSSILNFGSVGKGMVTEDTLCIVQAVLKQMGHVGTALWLLVIAIHTFFFLFYQAHPPRWVLVANLFCVWALTVLIILIGPVFLHLLKKGPPFYGNTGMWCWIKKEYPVERYTLHYGWQFLSALVSLILYPLLFFRLRGNIQVEGWYFYFQRRPNLTGPTTSSISATSATRLRLGTPSGYVAPMVDPQVQKIARNMMLYPLAYIVVLAPQTIVRFMTFSGHDTIPPGVSLFTATLLMLNGLIDVILFVLTRPSVTTGRTILPRSVRSFFGLLSEDGNRADVRQPASYHSAVYDGSNPPMGQTGGINVHVKVERQSDGSHITRFQGWHRPTVGLHGTVPSLSHHHHNHSDTTAYSNQDHRKISFEDEHGRAFHANVVKWGDETSPVPEEDDFIQYLQPRTPIREADIPPRVISIGFGDTGFQSNEYDSPTTRYAYNGQPMAL
ncbi:hypothetical protein FRC17_002941 [Serendipita sp. 399]|nr:hypothetical protein FRC17_002941 [Serendipita sp. 399]